MMEGTLNWDEYCNTVVYVYCNVSNGVFCVNRCAGSKIDTEQVLCQQQEEHVCH